MRPMPLHELEFWRGTGRLLLFWTDERADRQDGRDVLDTLFPFFQIWSYLYLGLKRLWPFRMEQPDRQWLLGRSEPCWRLMWRPARDRLRAF